MVFCIGVNFVAVLLLLPVSQSAFLAGNNRWWLWLVLAIVNAMLMFSNLKRYLREQ